LSIGADDPRVARAVFTLREAAGYLGLPPSTLHSWVRPSGGATPVVTCFPTHGREATVPFIGFAEAYGRRMYETMVYWETVNAADQSTVIRERLTEAGRRGEQHVLWR
jgi:hypothetical protein